MKADNINIPADTLAAGLPPVAPTPPVAGTPGHSGRTGLGWLALGLLTFGFAPLLVEFFTNLWGRAYYQFFPLALVGAVALVMRRLKGVSRPLSPGPAPLTIALLGGAFGFLAVACLLYSPWLASLAAVLCLLGVAWWTGGGPVLRAALPGLVLFLVCIPPPLNLDERLMLDLRKLAIHWSSRLLDLVGVLHALSGNVIDLPQRKLLVEEACSGINSVLLTLAACLFLFFWRGRSLRRILFCLPIVLATVLLGNVVRICFGAWVQFYHNIDILSGWPHQVVGLGLLGAYMILILSLDEWVDFVTLPIPRRRSPVAAPAPSPLLGATNLRAQRVSWVRSFKAALAGVAGPPRFRAPLAARWGLVAGCAFALLGLESVVARVRTQQAVTGYAGVSALAEGTTFTLPAQIGNWQRVEQAVPFHEVESANIHSQVWNYQSAGLSASLSFDYPFNSYHDVRSCYTGAGWSIARSELHGGDGKTNLPFMEVEMTREPYGQAALWFTTVDEHGHCREIPDARRTLLERWQVSGRVEPTSYRVQLLVPGLGSLSPAERQAAQEFFENARQQLFGQLHEKLRGRS